jgi:succinate dehydrogenase/fumarate reductase-like Fe-S protein
MANRGGRLACMTRVAATRTKEGEVTVEPTRFVAVLKDLVYDVDRQL